MTFDNLLKSARTALEDREEKLQLTYEAIERNLTLLGVTAVEDKLQEGVQETIVALRLAGIKVHSLVVCVCVCVCVCKHTVFLVYL